jgi:hypothetical protein
MAEAESHFSVKKLKLCHIVQTAKKAITAKMINPTTQRLAPRMWDSASLFTMKVINNYTTTSTEKSINMLQKFFLNVDTGLKLYNMQLINIGVENYMAINHTSEHHRKTLQFAHFCINAACKTPIDPDNTSIGAMLVRTAVHSGNVHSIVLDAAPFKYTVVGPSMAIVRFLEKGGSTNAVHCSSAVIDLINAEKGKSIRLLKQPNVLITPHTTMILNTFNAHPTYTDEFDKNNNTRTYLVHQRLLTAMNAGDVVLCPYTLKFFKASACFCEYFGFRPEELRSFRMLYGPDTDTPMCKAELKTVFEFQKTRNFSIILYNRAGTTTGVITISASYHKKKKNSGVSLIM